MLYTLFQVAPEWWGATNMANAILEVQNLVKRYGDLEAVRSNGIWRLVKRPDLPPSQKPLLLY